jgi:hypothetical protein
MDTVVQTPVRKTLRKSKTSKDNTINTDGDISFLQSSSFETKMRRFGYHPEQRIVLKRATGTQTIYYKSRSPMGFHVYIEVTDDEGKVNYNEDLTMEEMTIGKSLNIPYSIKQGVYDDSMEGMIVCPEGICRVGRSGNTTEMEECNYTYRTFHTDRMIQNKGSIIAYPVVLLGEIEANPDRVLAQTTKVMARIRRSAYHRVETSITNYKKELDCNIQLFKKFVGDQAKIAGELATSLKELQEFQGKSIHQKQTSEKEITFAQQVEYNLNIRNDKSCHFLELCSEIEQMTTKLRELSTHFENIQRTFDSEFNDITIFQNKTN